MRKLLTFALVFATMTLGVPAGLFAQSPTRAQGTTIAGQAVDAVGRALLNQPIELLRDGQVLQTTTTGSRGEWLFANVSPGIYIVRTMVNGQVAGVRVTVDAGQLVANQLIVAPSAAAPSGVFLAALGLFGGIAAGAGIAAAIITTVAVVTKSGS